MANPGCRLRAGFEVGGAVVSCRSGCAEGSSVPLPPNDGLRAAKNGCTMCTQETKVCYGEEPPRTVRPGKPVEPPGRCRPQSSHRPGGQAARRHAERLRARKRLSDGVRVVGG